jgi:hypothetical protein
MADKEGPDCHDFHLHFNSMEVERRPEFEEFLVHTDEYAHHHSADIYVAGQRAGLSNPL